MPELDRLPGRRAQTDAQLMNALSCWLVLPPFIFIDRGKYLEIGLKEQDGAWRIRNGITA